MDLVEITKSACVDVFPALAFSKKELLRMGIPQLPEKNSSSEITTKTACPNCGESVATTDDPYLQKIKAVLYLMAGSMVIFTPWILLGVNAYCIIAFKTPFPMYDSVMYFCGAVILGILGLLPYAVEIMKRLPNANGKL